MKRRADGKEKGGGKFLSITQLIFQYEPLCGIHEESSLMVHYIEFTCK
jgi:hypothetical protein